MAIRTLQAPGAILSQVRGAMAQIDCSLECPDRSRIELVGTGPNGEPIVQSSLGVALHDFSCVDAAGKLWRTRDLVPGRRVTLVPGRIWFAKLVAPKASRNFSDVLTAAAPPSPLRWGARGPAGDLAPIVTLDALEWESADVLYTGTLERIAVASAKEARP